MDGNPQTYKARLVAKGFRQTHGIDYDETFSLVAMVKSIRNLVAIAAYYDYEIWQMDVKTEILVSRKMSRKMSRHSMGHLARNKLVHTNKIKHNENDTGVGYPVRCNITYIWGHFASEQVPL